MKILLTTVKEKSAIDIIANGVAKNNPHHEIKIMPVHPKRPSGDTLKEWERLAGWADVLDFRYWKSATMLLGIFPKFRNKPSILYHYNPYDVNKEEWSGFDLVTICNKTMQSLYPRGTLVPLTIDLKKFAFNRDYTNKKVVGMSVSRIESNKGVIEVGRVCKELGYKFLLVGRVSEPQYMANIAKELGKILDFRENITDEELVEAYKEIAVLVINSADNYESGPLPLLEAMAIGVPVLTRQIGHVPDINNGKNMVVRKGAKEDESDLKQELKDLMGSKIRRESIIEAAWKTVKNRDERRTAIIADKLWHKVLHKEPLVSVIVATANRPEVLINNLESIIKQNYPSKEIVVCDDGKGDSVKKIIAEFRKYINVPIKYVRTDHPDTYGLSSARNLGIIESIGDILVFCDDRLTMEQGALQAFAEYSHTKKWLWGIKDGAKKGFVENFSCVQRKDIINGGMFNERITKYGGMTQDIRHRFEKGQGMVFEMIPIAKANAHSKSSSRWSKREDIIDSKTLLWKLYD